MADWAFGLGAGRWPAYMAIHILLLFDAADQADRSAEMPLFALRTLHPGIIEPIFAIEDDESLFGEEGQFVSFAAFIPFFEKQPFFFLLGDKGTDEMMRFHLILAVDGNDAILGLVGTSQDGGQVLNFEGLGAAVGTSIVVPFGLECAGEAEEFLAGSFASNGSGAQNKTNGALILLVYQGVFFCLLHAFLYLFFCYIED